jgi:AraC family transcriptional regulator of adaptative response/methylated-DNA-[protein]-cysteine methyltransferase
MDQVRNGREAGQEKSRKRQESQRSRVETLNRACRYLEDNFDRDISLKQLGAEVGWSPDHLQRVFRERLGVSPTEYVRALRVNRMKRELRAGEASEGGLSRGEASSGAGAAGEMSEGGVSRGDASRAKGASRSEGSAGGESAGTRGAGAARAIFESGFGSLSAGHEAGVRHLGMTPATYGAGGLGARIEYCPARCSLGWLMVGRTDRGICSLALGSDPEELLDGLKSEFPQAELIEGDDSMADLCQRLVCIADHGEDGRDLPVEVLATDFQWRVWRAMRQIPPGETRSYSELAEMAGVPGATRAVGTACGRNPVSLLIPCHRVVRADGSIGNYAWGSERKATLLRNEADRRNGAPEAGG